MRCLILHLIFISALVYPACALAAGQVIIRDAEIEGVLKDWADPLIQAAGLSSEGVKIIVVQSPETNAFVAGGQNIFIYTGLLQKTKTSQEVMGVLAHELGHIAGGHLVRGRTQVERASYEAMLGTLLGIGVAVATGSGEAAVAIQGGAQSIAARRFLAFSRTQESAADQAALRFLNRADVAPAGFVDFLKKLEDQELLPADQQNPYIRTHPISRDRIEIIESALSTQGPSGKKESQEDLEKHARMVAKLTGFVTPDQIDWVYPKTDHSIPARYARAISAYRRNAVKEALTAIDELIAEEPKNPYFHELKGQMLYDFGRVAAAVPSYARARDLAPDEPLIQLAYAQALAADLSASSTTVKTAISILEKTRETEPYNPRVYRLLGTLYGRQGQEGVAQALLAEEAFLKGNFSESRRLVEEGLKTLPKKGRHYRMALDLLAELDQREQKKKNK